VDYPYDIPIAGNAFGDHEIWQAVYRIAGDKSRPVSERARAIRHMDKLTGEDESSRFGDDDAAVVSDYENTLATFEEYPET
jgi:hypothetical protein